MIIVLLVSNINLTLGKHFCGEYLVDQAWMLGKRDLNCGMNDPQNVPSDCPVVQKSCCENHFESLETDDALFMVSTEVQQHVYFFYSFVFAQIILFSPSSDFLSSAPKASPAWNLDRTVLFQNFLI